jgi:NADP-dependent 3-hydroxy acid dehydrogenase YdfG
VGHRRATQVSAAAGQPTAVITGCSTGIGRQTALLLAQKVSRGRHAALKAHHDRSCVLIPCVHDVVSMQRLSKPLACLTQRGFGSQTVFLKRVGALLTCSAVLQGWHVFAGARSQSDLQLGQLHAGITPISLDVTS